MEKAGDTTVSNVTNASSPSGPTLAIVAANVAQLHGEIDQLRMDLKLVIDLNNQMMTERLEEMDSSLFRRVCEARDRRFALIEEQEGRNRKRIEKVENELGDLQCEVGTQSVKLRRIEKIDEDLYELFGRMDKIRDNEENMVDEEWMNNAINNEIDDALADVATISETHHEHILIIEKAVEALIMKIDGDGDDLKQYHKDLLEEISVLGHNRLDDGTIDTIAVRKAWADTHGVADE